MEYLIRNRPHAAQTIIKWFFCDDTYAVVNIDNKCPKNFTQHPSVILLIPPKKKISQSQISGALKKMDLRQMILSLPKFLGCTNNKILLPMALHCESFACRTALLLPAVFLVPIPPLQGATGVVLWNTCRSQEYTFIEVV